MWRCRHKQILISLPKQRCDGTIQRRRYIDNCLDGRGCTCNRVFRDANKKSRGDGALLCALLTMAASCAGAGANEAHSSNPSEQEANAGGADDEMDAGMCAAVSVGAGGNESGWARLAWLPGLKSGFREASSMLDAEEGAEADAWAAIFPP